ncbi:MAG TPA: COX15/CtaA family protein [Polyangia bacterium]|jgi:heme A synthase
MTLHRVTLATLAATFLLLLVGGLVNPTGSALACPDWPTCFGSFFPPLKNGIQYEHTHRVIATLVGILTVVLMALALRGADRRVRWFGVLAVVLVSAQGLLGGLTVLWHLPLMVSTAHLALSMGFFVFLIYLAFRTRPGRDAIVAPPPRLGRGLTAAAVIAVYAEVLLGAFVRHTASGQACGNDMFLCSGALFPSWGPAQLHMLHRAFALVAGGLVIAAHIPALRLAERAGRPLALLFARLAPILLVIQIGLGMWSVRTFIDPAIITAHLGVGALLLGDMAALFFALGPEGVFARRRVARAAAPGGHLTEATP